MTMATTFTAPRPILHSYPLPGFPVPLVTVPDDPAGALLDELDTLIAELDAAIAEQDAARCTAATLDRRCSVIRERLELTKLSLAAQLGR